MITADDEKESVRVADKDGKNFLELDYKNGGVSVQADKKISLKAGSTELTMDGSGGNIQLKASKVSVSADNEIGLKANASLKMEGAQVDLKGQAQVNVQASGPLALKGAVVQVN